MDSAFVLFVVRAVNLRRSAVCGPALGAVEDSCGGDPASAPRSSAAVYGFLLSLPGREKVRCS